MFALSSLQIRTFRWPPLLKTSPSSFFAFSPSMTKHSKADNPALLSLPHFSLAFACRFSPAIESKLVQEQGVIFLKEELLKRLSHKNIGFLGKPNPLLPHELTTSLCTALSLCPNYKDLCPDLPTSPLQLAAALSTHPVPDVYFPKTVHDAEGLQSYPIPNTKGILMHLILPHSLRCPADAYFTQVVSHYPHLHRELDTGELRYGHFEDAPPDSYFSLCP